MAKHRDFAGQKEDFPLAVGAITGYRAWRVTFGDYRLRPLHVGGGPDWEVGKENVAQCAIAGRIEGCTCVLCSSRTSEALGHRAPKDECRCGFYAYHDGMDPSDYMFALDMPTIFGVIEGFGRTLIGDLGFRAEKARITQFYVDPDSRYPEIEKAIKKKYPEVPLIHRQPPIRGPQRSDTLALLQALREAVRKDS